MGRKEVTSISAETEVEIGAWSFGVSSDGPPPPEPFRLETAENEAPSIDVSTDISLLRSRTLGEVMRGAEVLPLLDSSPPSAVPAKEKESEHRATPLEVQREYFRQAMELYAISDPEANTAHVTEAAHKAALEGVRAEAMRISKEGQLDKDWKVAYEEAVSALSQGTSSSDGTTLVRIPPVARARAKKSSSPTIYEELTKQAEKWKRHLAEMRELAASPHATRRAKNRPQ